MSRTPSLSPLRILLCLPLIGAPAASAAAQDTERQDTTAAPVRVQPEKEEKELRPVGPVDSASVLFDGRVLFAVRGIPGFPAGDRADGIADRIRQLARDRSFELGALNTREANLGIEIRAGDELLFTVTHIDAELVGIPRLALADIYLDHIRDTVAEYRADREPRALLFRGLFALAATVVLVLVLLLLRWLYRRSLSVVERRYGARVKDITFKSVQIIRADSLRKLIDSSLRGLYGLTVLSLVYVYLNGVLGLFPWTRGFARSLLDLVLDPLRTIVLGLFGYLPNLLFIAILALVTRFLLRVIKLYLSSIARGRLHIRNFEPEWAWPTYRLIRIIVLAFFVVVAYPYIPGSGSAAFKGVSIFLGIIVSLGSSSVIGNVIAGYSMTYRRTFKVGDRVRIGDEIGDVREIRLLVTHLRSPKNEEIVVPNSVIIGTNVVNYSSIARREGLILHTTVGIGYEVPWRQVEAMLLEAAKRTEGLRREPPPFVLQRALGDFCVTYELNAYCDDPHGMFALYTALHRNILDVFNEYGVQIMTPSYEGDPEEPKIVSQDRWFESPASSPESQRHEPAAQSSDGPSSPPAETPSGSDSA